MKYTSKICLVFMLSAPISFGSKSPLVYPDYLNDDNELLVPWTMDEEFEMAASLLDDHGFEFFPPRHESANDEGDEIELPPLFSEDALISAPPRLQQLPESHTFDFLESFSGRINLDPSPGRWVYDWSSRRGVKYHSMGSIKYCTKNDPYKQACAELYQPDGLWLLYQNNTCCKLCEVKDGCGLVRPDFLSRENDMSYKGTKLVEGEVCYGYSRGGSRRLVNSLWTHGDGSTPCAFHEEIRFKLTKLSYDLTVSKGTFTEEVVNEELELPSTCKANCPTMWPWYSMKSFE